MITSPNKRKSQAKVKKGYLKVDGLFFSKNKCPIQAKNQQTMSMSMKKTTLWNSIAATKQRQNKAIPMKWRNLLVVFWCSDR